MTKKRNIKLAEEWFNKGDEDIAYAKLGLNADGPYGLACFHCHQAVEKYLKGYLVYQQKDFEKIHDLTLLLRLCSEINKEFDSLKEECIFLNVYYIPPRYPVPEIKEYSKEELQRAMKKMERIILFVKRKLK